MLKVLLDYQHFSEQRYGGITRYFANLMDAINADADVTCELGALHSRNYYLRNEPLMLNNALGNRLLNHHVKREIYWNRQYSKYLLGTGKYDVFHPTYYHPYFLDRVKKPFVVTVHDMIHEKFTGSFLPSDPVAAYKKEVVVRASKIIAVSESTKTDLIEILDVPEGKIEVIHHGIAVNVIEDARLPLSIDIPQKFVLYVGDRAPYKNFNRFAEALSQVFKASPDIYLICAGGQPFTKAEVQHLTAIDVIHKCIRVNLNDRQLAELYQNALVFVFPSLHEGFGLPLLEAFNNLCPVACSNTGSLPEVAKDAALYFNPLDVADMARAILLLLSDSDLRKRFIAAGKERVKQFPLKQSIDKTIAVYRQLA